VRKRTGLNTDVQVLPNPARDHFQLLITSNLSTIAEIRLINGDGKTLQTNKEQLLPGSIPFTYNRTKGLPSGLYYLQVNIGTEG